MKKSEKLIDSNLEYIPKTGIKSSLAPNAQPESVNNKIQFSSYTPYLKISEFMTNSQKSKQVKVKITQK